MKADKVTVKITIECLSIDSVRALLAKVATMIDDEAESGDLRMADGDCVFWNTDKTTITF